MDPDVCLAEIRRLTNALLYPNNDDPDVDRLCELVTALDGWLMGGGFLPADWAKLNEPRPSDYEPGDEYVITGEIEG